MPECNFEVLLFESGWRLVADPEIEGTATAGVNLWLARDPGF
jgi:hypothetical protein